MSDKAAIQELKQRALQLESQLDRWRDRTEEFIRDARRQAERYDDSDAFWLKKDLDDLARLVRRESTDAALLADLMELRTANAEVGLLNASYLGALDSAYRALMSYAHGNTAPALAEEVATHVLATIEKASGHGV